MATHPARRSPRGDGQKTPPPWEVAAEVAACHFQTRSKPLRQARTPNRVCRGRGAGMNS
jgi:hypothetical protein